jgi:hypothetical protein
MPIFLEQYMQDFLESDVEMRIQELFPLNKNREKGRTIQITNIARTNKHDKLTREINTYFYCIL